MTDESLGQIIDLALQELDNEKNRLEAKLAKLRDQRVAVESEISTTEMCILNTQRDRTKSVKTALSGAGISLDGESLRAAHTGGAGRMTKAEKGTFASRLAELFNEHQGQRYSTGDLAELAGCDKRKIPLLLKSVEGWQSNGQRAAKRYFLPKNQAADVIA